VATTGPRLVPVGLNFAPPVAIDVENVNIIHPLDTIISTKIVNLRVDQAPSGGHSCARIFTSNDRLYPGEGRCVEIEYVVQLPKLIWLSSEDIYLFIEGYR